MVERSVELADLTSNEDRDLQTILALYDSSKFLTNLEEAVEILREMLPSGLQVEHNELLDDTLAVVCGDLSQIMELGIKDVSLKDLLKAFDDMLLPKSRPTSTLSTLIKSEDEEAGALGETENVVTKDLLTKKLINILRHPSTFELFLRWFEDENVLESFYASYAPILNSPDQRRIFAALRSLPQLQALPPINPSEVSIAACADTAKVYVKIPKSESRMDEIISSYHPNSVTQYSRSWSNADAPSSSQSQLNQYPTTSSNLRQARDVRSPTPLSSYPRRLSFNSPNLTHHSSGFFSPPKPGQTLLNYLQNQDTETCADLERENAHFFISEAVIAAVEQMHYDRRHENQLRPEFLSHGNGGWNGSNNSGSENSSVDGNDMLDTSFQHKQSFVDRLVEFETIDGIKTSENNKSDRNLNNPTAETDYACAVIPEVTLDPPSTPESMDFSSSRPVISANIDTIPGVHSSNSAESIAIRLLQQFQEQRLPKASELEWIVPQSDFPQRNILFLKETTPVADTSESIPARIRGNLEWAPLRQQIIYQIQPHITAKVAMVSQKGRCAGCGGKMDPVQQTRMRYCEYTGRYFCVCCHEYKTSVIPSRVLLQWDFTKYYVSNFAFDFISKIYRDPLFDIAACNKDLYKRSRALARTRTLRTELVFANEYIKTCRLAQSVIAEVEQLPRVLSEELHTYSLEMLSSVRDGIFATFLKPVAEIAVEHVLHCKTCSAKGFICEFCRNPSPLFPFQLSSVYQCPQCFSCFHTKCIKNRPCPKCVRRQQARREDP